MAPLATAVAPGHKELLRCYRTLYTEHPHALLPLETALPEELQYPARDLYRTVLTMILSVRMADSRLAPSLGKLFASYPDFQSLNGVSPSQLHGILRAAGIVLNNPSRNGNGARLWGLLGLYFGPWQQHITEQHLDTLRSLQVRGFGNKVVRLLQAYCFGNATVLPLDTPAFQALQSYCFYRAWKLDQARRDVEDKLRGIPGVSLVDFHELLRLRGQAGHIQPNCLTAKQRRIIIGWHAWRLLLPTHAQPLTPTWVRQHLVQNTELATALVHSVRPMLPRTRLSLPVAWSRTVL
jgi:endonuclease III